MKRLSVLLFISMVSFILLTTCKKNDLPVISTVDVSEIATSKPISGGNITGDGESQINVRGVVWATNENPSIWQHEGMTKDGVGTGLFSSKLSGLRSETNYFVRAYATNGNGTSYGNQVSFKTTEAFPPMLRTSSIEHITSTTAISGGSIYIDGYAQITERGVIWNQNENDLTFENKEGVSYNESDSVEFISQITNLVPSTAYFTRAFVISDAGTSYGEIRGFYTHNGRPILSTIPVINITHEAALCGGIIEYEGVTEVTKRGVVWNLGHIFDPPSIDDSLTEDGAGGGSYFSSITGLASSQEYKVRAYAINSFGVSYGKTLTFRAEALHFTCDDAQTVTDVDGNVYKTIRIGDQCWMAENLKTTRYKNNTPIEYPGNNEDSWRHNTSGAYAWYNNDISWKDSYGALYNWYAVNNENGLCPQGWHVASYTELKALEINATSHFHGGGYALRSCRQVGSRMGEDCATSDHPRWEYDYDYGFDAFGFNGLPGGSRYAGRSLYQSFTGIGTSAKWWSSTENNSISAKYIHIYGSGINWSNVDKSRGYSVRCVKD